jgi:hypothetical protein
MKALLIASLCALPLALSGCGPIQGCGKDTDCTQGRTCEQGVCSGGMASGGGAGGAGGGNGTGGGSGSSKFTCCLNSDVYVCADKPAFDKCAGFDVNACIAGCPQTDFTCPQTCLMMGSSATHDPSSCSKDTTGTASCGTLSSCAAPTRNCSISADCGNNEHCTGAKCYADKAGCKCDISAECGTGAHCTENLCYADKVGSKCDISAECGTGAHCTMKKCYADRKGEPCNISADCGTNSSCVQQKCN